jgi:cobyrinic acid a,c-diamide synthase
MSSLHVCPALLISAPASGQGKTTITSGIARLFARRGLRVSVFKYGPDFIDPYWLELASGGAVYQLDMWMTGEQDCSQRLFEAAGQSDLILIEGAMGLFDGSPSAAKLAQHFRVPVVAVVDASAMAGTFGAIAHGLKTYASDMPWAGVFANRVASPGHAQMLSTALNDQADWLGSIERKSEITIPERHLGLVISDELTDAQARLDTLADLLESTPLGQMPKDALQKWNVEFSDPAVQDHTPALLQGKVIAIARDEAFCFIYAANIDALKKLGAEIVFFSPLHDACLPQCDALWLPGGYPELHLEALAANKGMLDSVKAAIEAQTPIWAECGGMMVLFDEIQTVDGNSHAVWGVIKGKVRMQKKLGGLGPQFMETSVGPLRGHTFHYSVCDSEIPATRTTIKHSQLSGLSAGESIYEVGSVQASYFHAWFASNLRASAALFLKSEQ